MGRVTLQAIADHVGVSKFAVSRALTGKPGVSDDTRRAVLSTAKSFGYIGRPPKAVQQSIEVIFRDHSVANRELWIDVQHGIEMEATRNGWPMAVRWTDDHRIVERLAAGSVGFILVGPQDKRMLDAIRQSSLPAVIVTHVVPDLYEIDQVTATDVEAGAAVATFLHGLGHRRLTYVHGQLGYPGRHARLRGFADAIGKLEGADLREISFRADYNASELRDAVAAMVRAGFEPTAFFCGSDGVAITVISELLRLGLSIPREVSVVGHADYPVATQVSPNLTTIHMPHKQMGIAAVRQLLSRAGLSGPRSDLPYQRISLVPHLVERQSTGQAANPRWNEVFSG